VREKEKEWSIIACLAEARQEGLSTSMLGSEGESEAKECEVGTNSRGNVGRRLVSKMKAASELYPEAQQQVHGWREGGGVR